MLNRGFSLCELSDHVPIYCLLPCKKSTGSEQGGQVRNITERSIGMFMELIASIHCYTVIKNTDEMLPMKPFYRTLSQFTTQASHLNH